MGSFTIAPSPSPPPAPPNKPLKSPPKLRLNKISGYQFFLILLEGTNYEQLLQNSQSS